MLVGPYLITQLSYKDSFIFALLWVLSAGCLHLANSNIRRVNLAQRSIVACKRAIERQYSEIHQQQEDVNQLKDAQIRTARQLRNQNLSSTPQQQSALASNTPSQSLQADQHAMLSSNTNPMMQDANTQNTLNHDTQENIQSHARKPSYADENVWDNWNKSAELVAPAPSFKSPDHINQSNSENYDKTHASGNEQADSNLSRVHLSEEPNEDSLQELKRFHDLLLASTPTERDARNSINAQKENHVLPTPKNLRDDNPINNTSEDTNDTEQYHISTRAPNSSGHKAYLSKIDSELGEDVNVELYCQPIVGLPEQNPKYQDCFGRLSTKQGIHLGVDEYRNIALRTGIDGMVEHFVLAKACQVLSQRLTSGDQQVFFINMSAQALINKSFNKSFLAWVEHERNLMQHVVFQIPIRGFLRNIDNIAPVCHVLRTHGVGIALKGLESLELDNSLLLKSECEFVKISIEVLREIVETPGLSTIVSQIQSMQKNNISIIADNVISGGVLELLQKLDIGLAEGDLFGKPRVFQSRF